MRRSLSSIAASEILRRRPPEAPAWLAWGRRVSVTWNFRVASRAFLFFLGVFPGLKAWCLGRVVKYGQKGA